MSLTVSPWMLRAVDSLAAIAGSALTAQRTGKQWKWTADHLSVLSALAPIKDFSRLEKFPSSCANPSPPRTNDHRWEPRGYPKVTSRRARLKANPIGADAARRAAIGIGMRGRRDRGLKMSDRRRSRRNFHGTATVPSLVPTELSALPWGQASREIPGDTFIGELRGDACHNLSRVVRWSE